jgi:copper chaperone NosL
MNTIINRRTLLLGAAGVALVGCGGSASADDPPKISYGKDICDRCRMIIAEERYAAGLVADNGDKTVYDDIGEMIATVQGEGLNARRVWVHDYPSQEWIDGTKAFFVASKDVMTPMGTGVIAFKERGAADEFAASHGTNAMTWEEVLQNWQIDTRMS